MPGPGFHTLQFGFLYDHTALFTCLVVFCFTACVTYRGRSGQFLLNKNVSHQKKAEEKEEEEEGRGRYTTRAHCAIPTTYHTCLLPSPASPATTGALPACYYTAVPPTAHHPKLLSYAVNAGDYHPHPCPTPQFTTLPHHTTTLPVLVLGHYPTYPKFGSAMLVAYHSCPMGLCHTGTVLRARCHTTTYHTPTTRLPTYTITCHHHYHTRLDHTPQHAACHLPRAPHQLQGCREDQIKFGTHVYTPHIYI